MEPAASGNRLAEETSPYLLQHADNPVHWLPWGEEAFARARAEDRPILVSIGYSSCHWCHVMEHESFENPEIAALMNELFVCVKVDREERPDVDEIYMTATQMMGMGGGWPLNVFLTPDGVPFFGGTYFPPDSRYGRSGWPDVLTRVAAAWRDQRERVLEQGNQVVDALRRNAEGAPAGAKVPEAAALETGVEHLLERFDARHGGFQGAPKFPPSQAMRFLLRRHAREDRPECLHFVETTLRGMADGGIRDQLGGGFHRYSVDEKWLVPHFEKMLYDNAQLARVYVEAFQVTGDPAYEAVARETLDYVLREMTEPSGGFRSATDADSDGREGVYFVWTKPDLERLLGDEAPLFLDAYGVTERGNFQDPHHPTPPGEPGMNVLHRARAEEDLVAEFGGTPESVGSRLEAAREVLRRERAGRTPPGLDDKILASWNGLMIGAFAYAGRALDEPRYVEAARAAAAFVRDGMRTAEGRLLRTHRGGRSKIPAFLDDHAYLADGCLDLYEATFDAEWFRLARDLAAEMQGRFAADGGGFHYTASDAEELITRSISPFDGAEPSANGVAAQVMLRLAAFTGDARWRESAEAALKRFAPAMEQQPGGTVALLLALDDRLHEDGEVAFVGRPDDDSTRAMVRAVARAFRPGMVTALRRPGDDDAAKDIALLAGKELVDGEPAAYVCRNFACRAPVTGVAELERTLALR